jgi:tight adherence protein B
MVTLHPPLIALAVVATGVFGAPAAALAQDELPPPPTPTEAATTPAGDLELDLGVEFDENGNPIWNGTGGSGVSPTTGPTEATVPTEPGIGNDEPATTGTDAERPAGGVSVVDSPAAAGGGGLPLVPIGAAVLVAAAATVLLIRRRRSAPAIDVATQLEQPLVTAAEPPLRNENAQPAQYAGATEAGAYQVGGAAYAQYVNASYGAAEASPTRTSAMGQRLQGAKAAAARVADRQLESAGKHKLLSNKIAATGSQITPGEWLVTAIMVTLAGATIGALLRNIVVTLLLSALGAWGSWARLGRMENKRRKAFAHQLPETLGLIAGSLRGGMSMIQSISTVADEADSPTSDEFQRVVTEIRLGRDLTASFREMARRMDSRDFEWAVISIDIHREVGGDLAVILDRLSDTIRARNRVFGQMKALSAEGRMSGLVLFFLPPCMVGLISLLNPEYLSEMTGKAAGVIMLVGAAMLLAIGGAWMKRLVRFDY